MMQRGAPRPSGDDARAPRLHCAPVARWIPLEERQPFLATGATLSERVFVAQLHGDRASRSLRARQTADRRSWRVGRRALAWTPTHWAAIPEVERKLMAMLAKNTQPMLRLREVTFSITMLPPARANAAPSGPGVIDVHGHDGTWLARISGAEVHYPPRLPRATVEFIRDAAREPMPLATEHARYHGMCCFCGRPLRDQESLRMGMGPQCRIFASA